MKKTREPKLYKIEKGVKVPDIAVNREPSAPSRAALTLQALEKGDSFLIKDELEAMKATKVVRDFQSGERGRGGSRAFTTRKTTKGSRIWRTQ